MKTETQKKAAATTLGSLLAAVMADIDIFLLLEKDQKTDKNKLYTKEEIRQQLENTLEKVLSMRPLSNYIDTPLLEALAEKNLRDSGISEHELKRYKKEIDKLNKS